MHLTNEFILLACAMLAAGVVSGFLAGLFGVGGGAILVPVFYQVFGLAGIDHAVTMHVAVASSLAIIVPTSIRSFVGHYRQGAVDMDVLKGWLVAVPAGTLLASVLASYLSGSGLRIIFAVFSALMAIRMLSGAHGRKPERPIPTGPVHWFAGGLVGLLSGLLGVGGGVLANFWLSLFGHPLHRSVATSSGVGVLISLPGLLGYMLSGHGEAGLPPFSTGYVNWIAVALVIPVTFVTAPMGVKLAHRWPRRTLEIAFGTFLGLVSLRFAASLLG